jgi:hypothetical protein
MIFANVSDCSPERVHTLIDDIVQLGDMRQTVRDGDDAEQGLVLERGKPTVVDRRGIVFRHGR